MSALSPKRPARTTTPPPIESSAVHINAKSAPPQAKRSNEGRDYLGLKLDDPSFTAPIYANLFADEGDDSFSLIWSRSTKRNGD